MRIWKWSACAAAIVLLGAALHFVYDWTRSAGSVAWLAPVNESVWEHMKTVVFPMLLVNAVIAFMQKKPAALVVCGIGKGISLTCISILLVHYFCTGALAIRDPMIIDIVLYAVSVGIVQWFALRTTGRRPSRVWIWLYASVIALWVTACIVFTYRPPRLPLFLDSKGGFYGIPGHK